MIECGADLKEAVAGFFNPSLGNHEVLGYYPQ